MLICGVRPNAVEPQETPCEAESEVFTARVKDDGRMVIIDEYLYSSEIHTGNGLIDCGIWYFCDTGTETFNNNEVG